MNQAQFSFNGGELDPSALGRIDLQKYYSSAQEITNAIVTPHGGVKRLNGTEHIAKIYPQITKETSVTLSATYLNSYYPDSYANDGNLSTIWANAAPWVNNNNTLEAIKYDLGGIKYVVFVDILDYVGSTLSGINATYYLQVSQDNINWTTIGDGILFAYSDNMLIYGETGNRLRISINANCRYIRLSKPTTGEYENIRLMEFNVYSRVPNLISKTAFFKFEFNVDQRYLLVISDKNIAIYRDGEFQVNVPAPEFTNDRIPYIGFTQSADTAIFTHEDFPPQKLLRLGSDAIWRLTPCVFESVPRYNYTTTETLLAGTATCSALDGTITITFENFDPTETLGQYFKGNGGLARVVEKISNTVHRCIVEIPFYTTSAAGGFVRITGFEDLWSPTRGYPRRAIFYNGRLWFAGVRSRPQTIVASQIGRFFNFNVGVLNDNEALDLTLDTDQVNQILDLKVSNGSLLAFTSGDIFLIGGGADGVITPINVNQRSISNIGIEEGFNINVLGNANLFIRKGGKSLISYTYDQSQRIFANEDISLLAGHLMYDPIDFSAQRSNSSSSSDTILYINGANQLVFGTILTEQKVIGFTKKSTENGNFWNVIADNEFIYVAISRIVDGVEDKYLERFNPDFILDGAIKYTIGTPTNSFSGLDHLEGKEVAIIIDGGFDSYKVVEGGNVISHRQAEETAEIGLVSFPTLVTLPVESIQVGPVVGTVKRINKAVLKLKDTGNLIVRTGGSNEVAFRDFGLADVNSPLDAGSALFTGDKIVSGLLGWSRQKVLVVSQNEPAPFHLLNITFKVSL